MDSAYIKNQTGKDHRDFKDCGDFKDEGQTRAIEKPRIRREKIVKTSRS